MDRDETLRKLGRLREMMVAVATGGPRIDEVNPEFQRLHDEVADGLRSAGVDAELPYRDLWQWYGRWSSDLPSYASRRAFVSDLFEPIVRRVRSGRAGPVVPSGWARVDRAIDEARNQLTRATTEEQFQAVGLFCREALITLAQEVYDDRRHPSADAIEVGKNDFKRMIEAYFAAEAGGEASKELRRHARSALDLALQLQHQRTASFRDAAVCVEATASVVNIVAIVSGRRDPGPSR